MRNGDGIAIVDGRDDDLVLFVDWSMDHLQRRTAFGLITKQNSSGVLDGRSWRDRVFGTEITKIWQHRLSNSLINIYGVNITNQNRLCCLGDGDRIDIDRYRHRHA